MNAEKQDKAGKINEKWLSPLTHKKDSCFQINPFHPRSSAANLSQLESSKVNLDN